MSLDRAYWLIRLRAAEERFEAATSQTAARKAQDAIREAEWNLK